MDTLNSQMVEGIIRTQVTELTVEQIETVVGGCGHPGGCIPNPFPFPFPKPKTPFPITIGDDWDDWRRFG